MNREIKIKITKDGKVEVDSSVFEDCKEIAEKMRKLLGKIERFDVKDEAGQKAPEKIKIDTEK